MRRRLKWKKVRLFIAEARVRRLRTQTNSASETAYQICKLLFSRASRIFGREVRGMKDVLTKRTRRGWVYDWRARV